MMIAVGGRAASVDRTSSGASAVDLRSRVFLQQLARRLYQRECGGKREKLIWWSPHEPFPSLGIGHFIWLPEGVEVPFEATFPRMVRWVEQASGQPAPAWAYQAHAPWASRSAFLQDMQGPRRQALQEWLWQTRLFQAGFVIEQFEKRFHPALAQLPPAARKTARHAWRLLRQTPEGQWAMLDYFNFKGMGDQLRERYQGQGWGLIQVLSAMPLTTTAQTALPTFVEAARYVLHKRIRLAPPERNEARWWPGWSKRLEQYLE